MRFLDVKTDFAFKKVFGAENSKGILKSFLNSVIDFPQGEKIVDLVIVDPYQIPLIKGMKDTYLDVKVRLSHGKKVIIEMQVLNVEGFEQRVLLNAAKAYCSQLKVGEKVNGLEPIIALTITDFVMFADSDEVMSYFKLMEKERLVEYSDDIELIFIELPKFKKEEKELKSIMDKWIYFIKNAGSLEYIPEGMSVEKEIKEAFDIVNEAGLSEAELESQWKRRDFIMLQRGALKLARVQGMAEGKAEGKKEAKEEVLQNMIKHGIPKKKARQILGLVY